MQADYLPFVERMISKYEGGYGWDRGDSGGPTKYGITCYDLAEHRHQKMTSMAAWAPIVKAMTRSEADAIYAVKYKGDFDALPAGPDCAEFDYKVNSGVGRVRLVRPKILALAGKHSVAECDPKWYVDALCQERLAFMHRIRGGSAWAQFGHGWGARVADLKSYCDALASKTPQVPNPTPTVPSHPKATHDDPGLPGKAAGGAGSTTAGGGAIAAHSGDWHVGAAIMVAGIVAAAGWYIYMKQRNDALNKVVVLPATIPPHP